MPDFDVLILGAGIVGCACARELSLAGLRVGLVEPDAIGRAATAAAMGHLVVLDDSPAQLALTAYAQQLWRGLLPQLPQAVQYQPLGTLWVASDDDEFALVHTKLALYKTAGLEATLIDSTILAFAEPNLRPGLAGALFVPGDSVVAPLAAAEFFFTQAINAGATLLQGHTALHAAQGSVILSDGSTHTAAHIVIATGAATHLTPDVPLQKRKGQLALTAPSPGFLQHQVVELGYLKSAHQLTDESIAFNVQPRPSGQVLIGSSRQANSDDPAVSGPLMQQMLERAYAYMPALRSLPITDSWAGFRAATPDKLPYLGPTADPSVSLAMGFEGLGITTAPAAACLLAAQILGRTPAIDPTPYLPARIPQRAIAQETL
jgi:glycine/D-amino acid oxidase-like deaminating enzyme